METLLIVLGICAGLVGITYLQKYLKSKDIQIMDDLIFAAKVLDLTVDVIDTLELKKVKKIRLISEVIGDGLAFTVTCSEDKYDIINSTIDYTIEVVERLDIEITPELRRIITSLVNIAYDNKYID